MKRMLVPVLTIVIIAAAIYWDQATYTPPGDDVTAIDTATLAPDWGAISSWPPVDGIGVEPASAEENPDPWQLTTLILLDDSASMNTRMEAAKQAVIEAVGQLAPESRVGIVALNAGIVLPVTRAGDAARSLPAQLAPIKPSGATPLGARLSEAMGILAAEARQSRGFGVYRILVTTDGAASDGNRMNNAVAEILSTTPIELATIGVGIGEGHALNVPGYTSYVSVSSVDDLASALTAAAAEQTVFQPITQFEE
ncbi:MAG: vWA domain-containing protein [Pseudomonadota bacterium]